MHHNLQGGDSCDCAEDFQGCLWSLGSDCGESRGELCQDIPHLPHLQYQVKNLSVASEMVKSMAIEAQAAREANSMLVMQNGEGRSLEKIRYLEGHLSQIPVLVQFNITRGWRRKTTTNKQQQISLHQIFNEHGKWYKDLAETLSKLQISP